MGIKNMVMLPSGLIEVEHEDGTRMQFHPDHLAAKEEAKPENVLGQVRELYAKESGKTGEGAAAKKGKVS